LPAFGENEADEIGEDGDSRGSAPDKSAATRISTGALHFPSFSKKASRRPSTGDPEGGFVAPEAI